MPLLHTLDGAPQRRECVVERLGDVATHGGRLDCHPSLSRHLHALQRASIPGQTELDLLDPFGFVKPPPFS